MDSSTRITLLTEGLKLKPSELTPEERLRIALFWVDRLHGWFKHLPMFQPLKERKKVPSHGKCDDQTTFGADAERFGDEVDGRIRVAGVKQIKWELSGRPRVRQEGRSTYRGGGEIVDVENLLLSERGRFLLERWNYKDTPGVGWKHRGTLHEVKLFEVKHLEESELLAIAGENSFLRELMSFLIVSFEKTGEDKVRRGQAMIDHSERIRSQLAPIWL